MAKKVEETTNEPKVYTILAKDCEIDNFGTISFSLSELVKVWKDDADGVRSEIETNVISISANRFIRQFANLGEGEKGLITALANIKQLKSIVVLGCCITFDIVLRNVTPNDTYIASDGTTKQFADYGTLVDVVKVKPTNKAQLTIAKYKTTNVYNSLANDALAML